MTSNREKTPDRRMAPEPEAVPVTAQTLDRVQFEPLRAEASAALARGEEVALLVGAQDEGARVETILFAPSGRAAQSTGTWVFSGLWNGARLLTLNGHSLDPDGSCFCRACETAVGLGRDED
jgi:hypothetical protein